jgi:hypothetical protein
MRRKLLAVVSAPILALGLAAPALATGPVMPPSLPQTPEAQFFYDMWFGSPDPEWTPQGTVVADSGFRPTPNGFPYVNYAGSFTPFNLFFDMPDNALQPMTPPYMRSLYGDGVCAGPVRTDGSCTMTPAAQYMAVALLEQVDGVGHCVGFAVTSAGLFNGQIDPSAVSARTLAGQSQLTLDTQNVIARNWATQKTTPKSDLTPAELVQQLIEDFQTPGSVPNILILWGSWGGHGITPFAVYDRGNGQYDIAVYDNNYPFQSRAIHVDVEADTWEYQVLLNPSAPPTMAGGDATTRNLQLQSVGESLATQACPVCAGGRDTNLVVMNPLPTTMATDLTVDLLDSDGNPLPEDRANALPPLDSGNSDLVGFPAFDIDPGDGFTYVIVGEGVTESFPLKVTDLSVNGVKQVSLPSFPAGANGFAEFDAAGVFGFAATVPVKPRMERVFTEGVRHYTSIVYGGQEVAGMNARTITVKTGSQAMYYGDANSAGGSMTVVATLSRANDTRKFRATNVAYPAGGQLVLDYSNWKRTTQRPIFGVDTTGDGKINVRVPMRRVGR